MDATRSTSWQRLAAPVAPAGIFDPADVEGLPAPAQRLLRRALAPGSRLASTVILDMAGEIRLRRWMPFRARQVLAAGAGFMWAPRVGRPPLVFTGADTHVDGHGTLDFRLWGLVPVARESGPDTDRSAAGRLAAETVAWLPQALVPAMGATWRAIDDTHATVGLPVGERSVEVTVTVADDGRLRALSMHRWGTPDDRPPGAYPFGGDVSDHRTFAGVTIASAGRVGWWWATPRQDDGVFFRYRISRADFRAGADPGPSPAHGRRNG